METSLLAFGHCVDQSLPQFARSCRNDESAIAWCLNDITNRQFSMYPLLNANSGDMFPKFIQKEAHNYK